MDVRNCKSCGKLYNYYYGHHYCPACETKLEDTFKEVREYIYNNPNAGIHEVAKEFDISTNLIRTWIRQERLSFSENSMVGIACEGCGETIRTGRFCDKCKQQLTNDLSHAYKKEEGQPMTTSTKKDSPKMRFLE